MTDDNSTKIYARQYTSKKGNKYYWGKYGGYEIRIFKGREHEGIPQLDVFVRTVDDEPRDPAPPQAQEDDDASVPF